MRAWLNRCRRVLKGLLTLSLEAIEDWVVGHEPNDVRSPVLFSLSAVGLTAVSLTAPWPWATISGISAGVSASIVLAWFVFCYDRW